MDPMYHNIGHPAVRLMEECSELIKAICKGLRFGLKNYHPNDPKMKTNEQYILDEMSDVYLSCKDLTSQMADIRLYDFEGRCTKCHTRLLLRLDRTESRHKIILSVIPCKLHPKESVILWPQREDLIHE